MLAVCPTLPLAVQKRLISVQYQVTGLESPAIMGEPLNVIISGASDERVLAPTSSNGGIYNYFEALGYGGQCMGLAIGGKQAADLGDGQGPRESSGVDGEGC